MQERLEAEFGLYVWEWLCVCSSTCSTCYFSRPTELAEIAVNPSILLFHLLTLTASDFFFPLPFFTPACLSQSADSVFSRSASNHEPQNATIPPYPAPPSPYLFVSFCMDDRAGRCCAIHTNTHVHNVHLKSLGALNSSFKRQYSLISFKEYYVIWFCSLQVKYNFSFLNLDSLIFAMLGRNVTSYGKASIHTSVYKRKFKKDSSPAKSEIHFLSFAVKSWLILSINDHFL